MNLTLAQEQTIIKCLLDKRLSLDVAAEVFDHMVLETTRTMEKDDCAFDLAWTKTRKSWMEDLRTSYNAAYSLDDITDLMKQMIRKRRRKIWFYIVPLSLLLTLLEVVALVLLPGKTPLILLFLILISYWVLSVQSWKWRKQIGKEQKEFKDYKLAPELEWVNPLLGFITVFFVAYLIFAVFDKQPFGFALLPVNGSWDWFGLLIWLPFLLAFSFDLVRFKTTQKIVNQKRTILRPFLQKVLTVINH